MRAAYIATAAAMTLRELARRRLVFVLALCLPAVFFAVAYATESNRLVPVVFATAAERVRLVEELDLALLFISIVSTGLISAFFAASLIQRQLDANHRLVLCGFQSAELIVARLLILLGIIVACALYMWIALAMFMRFELFTKPQYPAGVLLGIAIGAFVYGCYGLLVGTLFRRELEAIFAILILINVDAGWLQNPIYYQNARSKWLIETLPAHYPSQIAFLSACTSENVALLVAYGLAYGGVFLLAAVLLYAGRMSVTR